MNPCPCGSGRDFNLCCNRYISGEQPAPTAETLMRSRYSAYTVMNLNYITATIPPEQRSPQHRDDLREWAENMKWVGLDVVRSEKGTEQDQVGQVEFKATYEENGQRQVHHELSTFRKLDGRWYYVKGERPAARRPAGKVGRNDPCPCGSGRKYKKCCAGKGLS